MVDWADGMSQQEAWTTTLAILESQAADAAAKLFAATTLKGKVGHECRYHTSGLIWADCLRPPPGATHTAT